MIKLHSNNGKSASVFLCFMFGIVFAPDLRSQPPIELLNRLENYNSSTCQIAFGDAYTCSGVLINNTGDPGRPLILTAAHCLESEADLDSIVVTFGKRKLLKDHPYSGWEWSSDSGATRLASSKKLDFTLLELKSRIPDEVAPVFLGWNSLLTQPAWVSSIHSSDFGDTQYSFGIATPSPATFDGIYHSVAFGFWKVDQWARGITSLGSSGAPLLDSNFQIIGALSGSTDWDSHKSDYFFRFDLAYDHFSDTSRQLKAWIDPDNSGQTGHYRSIHKVRNYQFTSSVAETVSLVNGAIITEEFSAGDDLIINGVYISVGEMSSNPGSILTVTLSKNNSRLLSQQIVISNLSQLSENYVPLITPPSASGTLSVALKFESTDPSAYITIPKTGTGEATSYFLALNSGRPE